MQSEPYTLLVEERPEYLFVRLTASALDIGIATQYVNEMLGHIRRTGASKILFVREVGHVAARNHFAIITSMIANHLPKNTQFAVVAEPKACALIKACMVDENSRKTVRMDCFDTIEAAGDWLAGV